MSYPHNLSPLDRPTLYFLGVSTARSSINAVFPRWAQRLGLGPVELRGWDLPLRDGAAGGRAMLERIKGEPLARGALVTVHKVTVFHHGRDLFDEVDLLADVLGEIASIYKRDGRLCGRAVDALTSGLALDAFVGPGHWRNGAEVLILGGGGAGGALAWHLACERPAGDRPACVHVADCRPERLEAVAARHAGRAGTGRVRCHAISTPEAADALVRRLPPASLVVNATGLGKDEPGSPVTSHVRFPERGLVWDFNYRGELDFLRQARAQQAARQLHCEDGWTYFLQGWTRVIADVFACEIPTRGELFDDLGRIATAHR